MSKTQSITTTTGLTPVALMHPIATKDGRQLKEITFGRRLKGADFIEVDSIAGGNARTAHLIARCNGDITPDDVAELDAADFLECQRRVEGFLEYLPPTSAE